MTVSNSNNFNQNRNQIINLAYKRIGVLTDYNALTAAQVSDGATLLNIMVKAWIAKGDRLWKTKQGTLFVQPNQASYVLDGATDNATEEYVSTTTTANVASGAFVIPVTSVTGMAADDFFGVVLNDGSVFWSTIASIASLNVTLDAAVTDDITSGSYVYAYTTKISRPEDIDNAQCKNGALSELPMVKISRDTYRAITLKTNTGIPNRFFYDKQLDYGVIYLWQVPSNATYLINFTFQKPIFDFDSASDDPDFPVEWIKPLYLNLSIELAGFNSISDPDFLSMLNQQASAALTEAEGFDRETTSIYFEPATETNTNTYR